MILNNIGYIICESAISGFDSVNIIDDKNGRLIGEGILQTANETNRNTRYYSSSELFPQLEAPRTKELLEAGYLRAELGHPLSPELVRQQTIDDSRTCAQFLKLWTEGNNVWARFRGTNNTFGEVFNKDLMDGCKPAWSLRAIGTIVKTPNGNEVKNLRVITWDQVIYPSHPSAYTQRVVSESAGSVDNIIEAANEARLIPITNTEVLSYIRSESANFKHIKETFDFAYDNISLNHENGTVSLTCKNGDILVVNLENYIHNEIMSYCKSKKYLEF